MLACADGGRVPSTEESAWLREHVQAALKLTDEQLPSFLDFFGYWLGNGSVGRVQPWRASGYSAVSCSQVKKDEPCFLDQCVHQLGLSASEYVIYDQPLQRCNQPDKIITHLRITASRWVELFDREFGSKPAATRQDNSSRSRSVSTSLSTASTVLDESTEDELREEPSSDDELCGEKVPLAVDEWNEWTEPGKPTDPDYPIKSVKW